MQTLRKLPMIAPKMAAKVTTIVDGSGSSAVTQDLVQENAGGNSDVERLHAGGEWDGHSPACGGRERRTDSGALVAQNQCDRGTIRDDKSVHRLTLGRGSPELHSGPLCPRQKRFGLGGNRRQTKERAHAATHHLAVTQLS